MKFRDGLWQVRKGFSIDYAAHAYEVAEADGSLEVLAPTRRIERRGDTLNQRVVNVTYTSPMPDVIGVDIEHHRGGRVAGPDFELYAADGVAAEVVVDAADGTLTSGHLTVRVSRTEGWHVDFEAEGRTLSTSGTRSIGVVDGVDGSRYVHEQLSLGIGATVYGLGERFGPLVKNGQNIDMWNADGGTSSEQAYKNVPFYLTNEGYGVFVAEPGLVSFEVASEHVSRVQFSVAGERLRYYVVYGPSPKEILDRYTALTGRPALPPWWSFGLWLSTSFTTAYDEETVVSFVEEMERRRLPLSVFHFDTFWMHEFHWCDFEWDRATFPDPKGMLGRLHERGLRVCVWINPYIAQRSALFAEAAAAGYLLRRPNGDVWQTDLWQAGMGIVDLTDPDARRWYGDKLRGLLEMGVTCFKTDFGERIPTDVVWSDGSNPERMHNYYAELYNRTVFEVLEEVRGKGEAVLFARSATAGGQQYPVHWGGDNASSFESMAETLRGGLSLGMCGFGFWSHDIGGFEGRPDPAVFKRWLAFGLLSSHSRLHGSTSYRVPWQFDDEASDVLRHFTTLKLRLMPYLAATARAAHEHGTPMMRSMMLEFPDDPTCLVLDRQYLLGDSLLVAPVFSSDGTVTYYLPAGTWTDFETGERSEGGGWRTETHSFSSVPLWIRPDSIVAFAAGGTKPDDDWQSDLTLRVSALSEGRDAVCVVPGQGGGGDARFVAVRRGDTITVRAEGVVADWRVELLGDVIVAVDGASRVDDHRAAVSVGSVSVDSVSVGSVSVGSEVRLTVAASESR